MEEALPWYRCPDPVQAFEIGRVIRHLWGNGALLVPKNPHYPSVEVSDIYVRENTPIAGGYYVFEYDGRERYYPRSVFRRYYRPIEQDKSSGGEHGSETQRSSIANTPDCVG